MDDVSKIIGYSNEGNVFLTTPLGCSKDERTVFSRNIREATKNASQVLVEKVLKVPSRASDDDGLESTGGLCIFANCVFF